MVGLANKLKDEPFHLIASYCQRGTKESALASLQRAEWDEQTFKNLTTQYATMYPPLNGKIKYVPYYLIFDHTGKLRYHHMAGPYHGGNGDKYKEQIMALLKDVP